MSKAPVILITGASSGIGEATARLCSKGGFRVILAARRKDRLESLANEIKAAGGQALPIVADLTRLEDIERLVQTSLDYFSQIDVLFNNAGFGRLSWLEMLDPLKDIEAQIHINLIAVIQTTHMVLPHMIQRRSGHIINMASLAGMIATPTYSVYASSKFGIRGFSEALRREVSIWGIKVTGIYPGGVETEFEQHTGARRKTGIKTPAFLRLSADDVAREVMHTIRHPRRVVIIPGIMMAFIWLNAIFPGLFDYLMETRFVGKERNL